MEYRLDEDFAIELDAKDPLADFKKRFYLLKDTVYMDGNSLGLMSKDSERTLMRLIDEWKTLGIKGWNISSFRKRILIFSARSFA